MAEKFSQVGTQVQTQTQMLTPQQLLVSRLTELPVEALHERVDLELNDNVSLERDDSQDWDDDGATAEGPEASLPADSSADEMGDFGMSDDYTDEQPSASTGRMATEGMVGDTESFYDQLEEQIGFFHLSEHEEEILHYLIGSLDDDGLLRVPLQQVQDELEVYHSVETSQEELEHILQILQNFEPAGIGARNLQECLLLQVRHAPDAQSTAKQNLEQLLTHHFDLLMAKRWERIQRVMHLSDSEVHTLQRDVRRLNPRPGSSMGEAIGRNLQQITPDFIVDLDADGQLTLTLNNGHVPPLRVSADDLDFLRSYEGKDMRNLSASERDGIAYLRDRVEKAQGFIAALQQRRRTLTSTMQAIMAMQRPFFETGDETLLRPMTLEDIAQRTGLHLSTVSRVSNAKWVQTPWGIYPLKWFFTSAARLQEGGDISVRAIKVALKEIIDGEDKKEPLSDEALTQALHERGFDVARRTVAKYRDALGYPIARLRI